MALPCFVEDFCMQPRRQIVWCSGFLLILQSKYAVFPHSISTKSKFCKLDTKMKLVVAHCHDGMVRSTLLQSAPIWRYTAISSCVVLFFRSFIFNAKLSRSQSWITVIIYDIIFNVVANPLRQQRGIVQICSVSKKYWIFACVRSEHQVLKWFKLLSSQELLKAYSDGWFPSGIARPVYRNSKRYLLIWTSPWSICDYDICCIYQVI